MKKTLVILLTSFSFFSFSAVFAEDMPKMQDNHLTLAAVPHNLQVGDSSETLSFHRNANGDLKDISFSETKNIDGEIEQSQRIYTQKGLPHVVKDTDFSDKELSELADRISKSASSHYH